MDERICEGPINKGLILPFVPGENEQDSGIRAVAYGLAMLYSFMGVSIVSDTFMGAIESVTSKRRKVTTSAGSRTVKVWNDTVANLTLMALGSSAPEIMLSVIELFKNNFYSGELGPSTIVGSAAFNLLMIIAVCILVIPEGEGRKIKVLSVFYVTSVFSLFAYLWLVVILNIITPNIVDVWEAVATLLFLVILVYQSYLADVGKLSNLMPSCMKSLAERPVPFGPKEDVHEYVTSLCQGLGFSDEGSYQEVMRVVTTIARGSNLNPKNPNDIEYLANHLNEAKHASKSRATRRIEAVRAFSGGKKGEIAQLEEGEKEKEEKSAAALEESSSSCVVQFLRDCQCLSRDVASKTVLLTRSGDLFMEATVRWALHLYALHPDGSAKVLNLKEVYVGEATFKADQKLIEIQVPRPIPPPGHSDSAFAVRLRSAQTPNTCIGAQSTTTISVVPEEKARLVFFTDHVLVQGTTENQVVDIAVHRLDGCSGAVSCKYRTEKLTAVPGFDYLEMEGTLEFAPGVTEQVLSVTILPKGKYEVTDRFLLVLEEIEGNAAFDAHDDGGEESAILTVTVRGRNQEKSFKGSLMRGLDRWFNTDELRQGTEGWVAQFVSAIYCNGSKEAQAAATNVDWFFHIVCIPWKVTFAFVPPTSYCGGWLCFFSSLVFIAAVTAIIGDLAELFGCVMNVPDSVTAITFVALGTSMPDLFASRTAACQDPWADASVCNVTGSNSVNVFLGLGFPWTLAALYWGQTEWKQEWYDKYEDILVAAGVPKGQMVFVVPADSFIFNVVLFCITAVLALVILVFRRRYVGVELGGPRKPKVAVSVTFVVLWMSYLLLASMYAQAQQDGNANISDFFGLMAAVGVVCSIFTAVTVVLTVRERYWKQPVEEPPAEASDLEIAAAPSVGVSLEELMKSTLATDSDDVAQQYGGWSEASKPAAATASMQDSAQASSFVDAAPVENPAPRVMVGVEDIPGGNGHAAPVAGVLPPAGPTVATGPAGADILAVASAAKQLGLSMVVTPPNATHEVATLSQHNHGDWAPSAQREAVRKEALLRSAAGQRPAGGRGYDRNPLIPAVKHVDVRSSKSHLLML
eukprot:TRINITY_DN11689_c0_g3_i1.p1 TRINITY_DN11689_c0_g3~~TRINITY_DN11689_c0_g3_i1.p1  ORF type:complete len:1087 (-),score=211.34 TRINITY_DN11689_c0_g3_i1:107-3367(-)